MDVLEFKVNFSCVVNSRRIWATGDEKKEGEGKEKKGEGEEGKEERKEGEKGRERARGKQLPTLNKQIYKYMGQSSPFLNLVLGGMIVTEKTNNSRCY